MIVHIILAVIIVLSFLTGVVTTIIENKELKLQRTQSMQAIQESYEINDTQAEIEEAYDTNDTKERVAGSFLLSKVKQDIETLEYTQQIEVLDFDDYEDSDTLKAYSKEII